MIWQTLKWKKYDMPFDKFTALAQYASVASELKFECLYRYAYEAGSERSGVVVGGGAFCGAAIVALSMGVRDANKGKVYAIDMHQSRNEIPEKNDLINHEAFMKKLLQYKDEGWVIYGRKAMRSGTPDWKSGIDLLWINSGQSYDVIFKDLNVWTPFLVDNGILILDDHHPGSEVEAAVRDSIPFSRFIHVERIRDTLVLRRTNSPRKMILCGGMQSSGSTLVSWCFLQHPDLDGVYDMENSLIQQDFSKISTNTVWVKMTIGAFGLSELVEFYKAQGWQVVPLLVERDINAVLRSLRKKEYGYDGCTGDDPPIFVRVQRYISDLKYARAHNWTIVKYEHFINLPDETLKKACQALGLSWEQEMITWPKHEKFISYMSLGNVSFRETRGNAHNLHNAISEYKRQHHGGLNTAYVSDDIVVRIINSKNEQIAPNDSSNTHETTGKNEIVLPVAGYQGTRRNWSEEKISFLNNEIGNAKNFTSRITNHVVFGTLLNFWAMLINPKFRIMLKRIRQLTLSRWFLVFLFSLA